MNRSGSLRVLFIALAAFLLGSSVARSPAPEAVVRSRAPEAGAAISKRLIMENERVRAHDVRYAPGAIGMEHEHEEPRVVVVLAGGVIELRDAVGGTRRLDLEPGDVVYRPAERHTVLNPGDTPVRLVEIDLLDGPGR